MDIGIHATGMKVGALHKEEAGDPPVPSDQLRKRTEQDPPGPGGRGRDAQPFDDRVGQLLLSPASQESLPGDRATRAVKVAQVAVRQARAVVAAARFRKPTSPRC